MLHCYLERPFVVHNNKWTITRLLFSKRVGIKYFMKIVKGVKVQIKLQVNFF